jgi:glycosyltransferase involved in cell wall biosynthesis
LEKSTPKVSVIIPAYNEELTIERSLVSLRMQTLFDWEAVVVDDGSSDSTSKIVERYSSFDRRIVLIKNEVNIGLGGAWNAGVGCARGEYISFLDADDALAADALETMCAIADDYNSDLVFGKTITKPEVDAQFVVNDLRNVTFPQYPALVYSHSVWGKLYKSSLLSTNKIRFDESVFAPDVLFSIEVVIAATAISITKHPVYYYTQGRQLNRATKDKIYDARNNVIRARDLVRKKYNEPYILGEVDRKVLCNSFNTLYRASLILSETELFEHLGVWSAALQDIDLDSVELDDYYIDFHRLVRRSMYDDAFKYWNKNKYRISYLYVLRSTPILAKLNLLDKRPILGKSVVALYYLFQIIKLKVMGPFK